MKIKKLINKFFTKKKIETIENISKKKSQKEKVIKTKKEIPKTTKHKYRISSPNNFKPISHIKHGTSMTCNEIPNWAKNSTEVVIEKLD